jgi:hypothetical protein
VKKREFHRLQGLETALAWIQGFDNDNFITIAARMLHGVAVEFVLIQYHAHCRRSAGAGKTAACFGCKDGRFTWEMAEDLAENLCWQVGERHAETVRRDSHEAGDVLTCHVKQE